MTFASAFALDATEEEQRRRAPTRSTSEAARAASTLAFPLYIIHSILDDINQQMVKSTSKFRLLPLILSPAHRSSTSNGRIVILESHPSTTFHSYGRLLMPHTSSAQGVVVVFRCGTDLTYRNMRKNPIISCIPR